VGDLKKRVLSALLFGPLVVALFLFLPPRPFFLFVAIVLIMAAYELSSMAQVQNPSLVTAFAATSFVPLYFGFAAIYPLWLLFSAAAYLLIRLLPLGPAPASPSTEIGRAVTVIIMAEVFLALPLFYLFRLKELTPSAPLILLLTIWASDTGAYFLGKAAGRHRLAPLISPKKTYEGLVGAMAGAALVTLLFERRLGLGIPGSLGIGVVIGLLGQLGDILESIAKRVCEVKDSSGLIPGHGGILDRIDSFLLTAPFAYLYLAGLKG
jgi:phosphatidate cytidylyltransferase